MSWLDWSVLVVYLCTIAGLGAWIGRGQKSREDFLLGARSIPWWAALLSLVATEISAATFLGAPEQGYLRNLTYLQFAVGTIAARFVLANYFIRAYYSAGVTTVYEFLGRRFGPLTHRTTAGLFLFGRLFADGSRLFIAAITIEVITGFPIEASILVLALVTILYTTAGGIKAVIWTDVLQAVVLVGAGLALLFSLFAETGVSLVQATTELMQAEKLVFFGTGSNWVTDPYHAFTAMVGGFFLTMATHGTDHDMVQRLLTCRNNADSRRSMWMSGLVGVAVTCLFMGVGLMLFLYLSHLSSEAELAQVAEKLSQEGKNGHFLLYYALAKLPPGVVGLMVAGVLAAAMSSLSSALNAMTASFVNDIYQSPTRMIEHGQGLALSRRVSLVVGVAIAALALMVANFARNNPQMDLLSLALGVMTFFYGGLLGIFLVALFTRTRGSEQSNILAAFLSTLMVFLLAKFSSLAWPWFVVVGTGVSATISVLGRTPKTTQAGSE